MFVLHRDVLRFGSNPIRTWAPPNLEATWGYPPNQLWAGAIPCLIPAYRDCQGACVDNIWPHLSQLVSNYAASCPGCSKRNFLSCSEVLLLCLKELNLNLGLV